MKLEMKEMKRAERMKLLRKLIDELFDEEEDKR